METQFFCHQFFCPEKSLAPHLTGLKTDRDVTKLGPFHGPSECYGGMAMVSDFQSRWYLLVASGIAAITAISGCGQNHGTADAPRKAAARAAIGQQPTDPQAPPLAVAPFNSQEARAHQQAWAAHLGQPVAFTNSIGMSFRLIPPGRIHDGFTGIGGGSVLFRRPTASGPDHASVLPCCLRGDTGGVRAGNGDKSQRFRSGSATRRCLVTIPAAFR
jgi:hypothetical protein